MLAHSRLNCTHQPVLRTLLLPHAGSWPHTHTARPFCSTSASAQTAAVLVQQQHQQDGPSSPQLDGTSNNSTAAPLDRPSKPPAVFRFRHFTLLHGGPCAMKMGTDAMLLGAWVQTPEHTAAVLDVGTGSGVLALMMAQKTQQQQQQQQQQQGTLVHALDIDPAAVAQAAANAAASPWSHRVSVHLSSLQEWTQRCTSSTSSSSHTTPHTPHSHNSSSSSSSSAASDPSSSSSPRYDVIITNPPYFLQSSKPDQTHRAAARHADVTLPFPELAACAAQLLAPRGRLCVVLPVQEAGVFVAEAAAAGLALTRLTQVYMKSSDKQPKRHLMEFQHAAAPAAAQAEPTAAAAPAAAAQAEAPAAAASLEPDTLVVLVPSQAGAAVAADAGSSSDSSSTGTSSSVTSSSEDGGSSPQRRPAALWVFSQQYRQMTVDFHHPDLLT